MKNVHIHINVRLPGIRQLGLDALDAVSEGIDALRGIRHLEDGVKLDTRKNLYKAPESANSIPDGETPPLSGFELAADEAVAKAEEGFRHVWESILDFAKEIRSDIDTICERDPAARSKAEVLMLYSGLHALMAYRLSHALHTKGFPFAARAVSQLARFATGIEIHPGATIGKGLFIDHGSGVVIGETAIVGDNCTLYQGVTLGGTGKDVGKRHPTLGDNVLVGAGAKLLGNFTVGDGAKIAAGAVVLGPVPENCTAVGIPARVVRKGGLKVDEFDQTHIPDPVSQELCRIGVKMEMLEAKIAALEKGEEEADEA